MNQENLTKVALWNPRASFWWSLIFSPIFGAWIHAKNWKVLGNETKAKQAMNWGYSYIAFLLLFIFLPDSDYILRIVYLINIIFLISFYFFMGKSQIKYVIEHHYGTYEKKRFIIPFGIAIASIILYFGLLTVWELNFNPEIQNEATLSNISGVWKEEPGSSLIYIQLERINKTIKIENKTFPVKVKSFDEENKIISLIVNNDPKIIWSIRQILEADEKSFTLNITLHNGTQADLAFVRNL